MALDGNDMVPHEHSTQLSPCCVLRPEPRVPSVTPSWEGARQQPVARTELPLTVTGSTTPPRPLTAAALDPALAALGACRAPTGCLDPGAWGRGAERTGRQGHPTPTSPRQALRGGDNVARRCHLPPCPRGRGGPPSGPQAWPHFIFETTPRASYEKPPFNR